MRNGCKVNFETREIIVTKKFLNSAETVGTEEFEILLRLTKELPQFHVRQNMIYRTYRNVEMIVA